MDADLYETLKHDAELRYLDAKEKAERDYESDLAAIDRVWELSQTSTKDRNKIVFNRTMHRVRARNSHAPRENTLKSLVLDVISKLPQDFDTKEVIAELESRGEEVERASVSSTIKKLAEDDDSPIVLVEAGKGSRASRYRKVDDSETEATGSRKNYSVDGPNLEPESLLVTENELHDI